MKKMIITAAMAALVSVGSQAAAPAKYGATCFACHGTGAAGAPMTGDAAAWKPRLEKGMDTLVTHAKNGLNAMPPRGLCMDCTDEEFKELIIFMSTSK
jgi:cytochrome c5